MTINKMLKAGVLLALSTLAFEAAAQGNSNGKGNGKGPPASAAAGMLNAKALVRNGPSEFKGNLRPSQHIYYVGDDLEINLQFPRGADLLAAEEAEAHVVIFAADGSIISVPVEHTFGSQPRKFFRLPGVSTDALAEGQYQLGLILTIVGGDPSLLEDWYGGFRALLDTRAIYISASALEGDADGDGEWDDDTDGDGIIDDDDDEVPGDDDEVPGDDDEVPGDDDEVPGDDEEEDEE